MIEIQHGCERVLNTENTYTYVDVSVYAHTEDYQDIIDVESKETVYLFIAPNGTVPEIGDFIENGVLIKRTTWKVNNDWSKWKDKDL